MAIGQTRAGLAIYCQVQADHSNPTDYVVHPNGPAGFVQFLVLNDGNGESGGTGPVQLIKFAS